MRRSELTPEMLKFVKLTCQEFVPDVLTPFQEWCYKGIHKTVSIDGVVTIENCLDFQNYMTLPTFEDMWGVYGAERFSEYKDTGCNFLKWYLGLHQNARLYVKWFILERV